MDELYGPGLSHRILYDLLKRLKGQELDIMAYALQPSTKVTDEKHLFYILSSCYDRNEECRPTIQLAVDNFQLPYNVSMMLICKSITKYAKKEELLRFLEHTTPYNQEVILRQVAVHKRADVIDELLLSSSTSSTSFSSSLSVKKLAGLLHLASAETLAVVLPSTIDIYKSFSQEDLMIHWKDLIEKRETREALFSHFEGRLRSESWRYRQLVWKQIFRAGDRYILLYYLLCECICPIYPLVAAPTRGEDN
jgi:hypothetical protein